MSEIVLTASVALASEVMHSLLAVSFPQWFNTRIAKPVGANVNFLIEKRKLKEIDAFSKSLQGFRIMKVIPGSVPIQDFLPESKSAENLRSICFHLGNERSPSRAIVEILLDDDEESDRSWGKWSLAITTGVIIRCLMHPDKKFTNCNVL